MNAGRYGNFIQKARQQENQRSGKPASQKTGLPENQQAEVEQYVNLCVRVPKSKRQHWASEAKRRGTTLTAVITEALQNEFGEP